MYKGEEASSATVFAQSFVKIRYFFQGILQHVFMEWFLIKQWISLNSGILS